MDWVFENKLMLGLIKSLNLGELEYRVVGISGIVGVYLSVIFVYGGLI